MARSSIAKIAAANIVSHSYAPNVGNNEPLPQEFKNYQLPNNQIVLDKTTPKVTPIPFTLTSERENLLFSKIDLDGAKEWDEELKVKTLDLFQNMLTFLHWMA